MARLISTAMIGWPFWLFIVLGAVELILPVLFWWMHRHSFGAAR